MFSRKYSHLAVTQRSRGFTLVELLVVVAIIAILASLLFPMFQGMALKKNEVAGASNMRQVGIAFMLFSGENNYTLPGRVKDGDSISPRWPAVLFGSDGKGTSVSTNYLKDVRLYAAAGDTAIDLKRPDLETFLTTNIPNHTSWLMNGYNDISPLKDENVQINVNSFDRASDTILLGMENHQTGDCYMDFDKGDNMHGVINYTAYGTGLNAGSLYLFQDGSVRFIKQTDYNKPAQSGGGSYGDWLWYSHKPQ